MKLTIKPILKFVTRIFNYEISSKKFPVDLEPEFKEIYERCKKYTMTSLERMYALYKAVKYIIHSKVPGDFVECGVWKGGSSMIMAYTLLKEKETIRKIYLYDTFKGMSRPTEKDLRISDSASVINKWERKQKEEYNEWDFSPLKEVKKNMFSTGYPGENMVFVKGKVEDTIPDIMPTKIALLRLDTDWYESTFHELTHLCPLLSYNGILIIDDYGHWAGAREAADQYFKENNITILLNRIDYSARIGIKL